MITRFLPEQPVIRAAIIILVAFAVYAVVAKTLGGSGMGLGGGAVVGAMLAFIDFRNRR